MRKRSRAQVAAIKANGRRGPKLGKSGDVVAPAALKAAGYFVPPLWKRATDSYDMNFGGFQGARFVETPKSQVLNATFNANAATDARIRELEDEILARRAKR